MEPHRRVPEVSTWAVHGLEISTIMSFRGGIFLLLPSLQ